MSRTHAPSGHPYNTQDPEEVHDLLWERFKGDMGWDIGAHQGQSTDRMMTQFQQVIALEPAAESFGFLKQEWGNRLHVMALNKAAAAHDGVMRLSVREVPISGGQLVDADLPEEGTWWGEITGFRKVECVTLDSLAREYGMPDFVKVDVEGGEVNVLAGAATVIGHGCDWLIEYHSHALRDQCARMLVLGGGYSVEDVPCPGKEDNGWLLVTRP